VFIGRLSTEKGVDVLIRALARAGDPPFRIIGDGPAHGPLRRMAQFMGLRNTRFLGRLERRDVHRVLEESRYLVMPSLWEEICPLAPLEGMAHGRAILVSSIGALSELVRSGEGMKSPPGDIDTLADMIRIIQRDDDLCREAGLRGWDLCRREYSPEVHLSRLDELYASCSSIAST
jgi:glycosyltransferase involved in cell wall biosynthesis